MELYIHLVFPPLQVGGENYAIPNPHNPFAAAPPAPSSNPFSGGFRQEAVQPSPGQYPTQGAQY